MVDIASPIHPELHKNVTTQDFAEQYELFETMGIGGFAVVKRGKNKRTGLDVAVKIVDKTRYAAGDNSLHREIEVLFRVNHPNCIRLYEVYVTPRKVYIVTELVTGGELLDRVTDKGNYSEQDAAEIIKQILQGVAYLHSQGIVHRDLKLENMLMTDERDNSPIKIADFGLSKFFSKGNGVLSTMCGSPQYVAPEILGMGDGAQEYSPAVDMWSVGVILFILLSGYSPFDDENDAVLFEKIKLGEYDADDPIWDHVSDSAKDLVARLLVVDGSQRLSAAEAMRHPWLQGRCPDTVLPAAREHLRDLVKKRKSTRDSLRLNRVSSDVAEAAGDALSGEEEAEAAAELAEFAAAAAQEALGAEADGAELSGGKPGAGGGRGRVVTIDARAFRAGEDEDEVLPPAQQEAS